MRERSLVAFTVLGQAAAGMLSALAVVRWVVGPSGPGSAVVATGSVGSTGAPPADAWLFEPLLAVGVVLLMMAISALPHLGSPRNAWRALVGAGSSWLSREILFAVLFAAGWALAAALYGVGLGPSWLRAVIPGLAALPGLAMVYAMARVYRLRTVPDWDTALTVAAFFLTAAVLGSLGAALAVVLGDAGVRWGGPVRALAAVAAAAMAVKLALLPVWRRHRVRARERVDPGLWAGGLPGRWATVGRAALLVAGLLAAAGATLMATVGAGSIGMALVPMLLIGALAAALSAELVGRAAFYRGYARLGL